MPKYEDQEVEEFRDGQTFFEVKRAIATDEDDEENQFLRVSKGFYRENDDGEEVKQYTQGTTVGGNPEIASHIAESLVDLAGLLPDS